MSLVQTVAPAAEPITLTEAKDHLNVDGTFNDTSITFFIAAARGRCESFTGRQLITATWTWKFEGFPSGTLLFPRVPLAQVNSIKYLNNADPAMLTTIDTTVYQWKASPHLPGKLALADGESWPTDIKENTFETVEVEFDAGVSSVVGVADELKQAMLLMIGHWFKNRENTIAGAPLIQIPLAAEDLMMPFKTEWHG